MDEEPAGEGSLNQLKIEDSGHHSLGLHDLYKAAFREEYQKEAESDIFQMYPMKPLEFSDSHNPCFSNNVPVEAFEHYENNENSSVLDLDKGVPVPVTKVKSDQANYSCDSHLLQRYLQDSTVLLMEGDTMSIGVGNDSCMADKPASVLNIDKPKVEDCDFNSSDSFASTESIIPKNITCFQCPKKFMFKSDRTRHVRRKHSAKPKLTCSYCYKTFPCAQNLAFHERSHKNCPDLYCNACLTYFSSSAQYCKHMEELHKNPTPFTCSLCPKAYRRHAELLTHQKKHHKVISEEGCACPTCGKTFDTIQNLTTHIKSHVPLLKCDTCGKEFKKNSSLKQHIIKKHHIIDSVDPSKAPLNVYFKTFTQENDQSVDISLECVECRSTFNTTAELQHHNLLHRKRKKKKFKCESCEREFTTKKAMVQHADREHKPATQETFTQTELSNMDPLGSGEIECDSQPIMGTDLNCLQYDTVPAIISTVPAYSLSS